MTSSIVGRPEVDEIIHVHPSTHLVRDAAMVALWLALSIAFLVQITSPARSSPPSTSTSQGEAFAMAAPLAPCAVDPTK